MRELTTFEIARANRLDYRSEAEHHPIDRTTKTTVQGLLGNGKQWHPGKESAVGSNGKEINYWSNNTIAWSITGAILKAYAAGTRPISKVVLTIQRLFPKRVQVKYAHSIIIAFNTHPDTTWPDVLKVIREANV